MAVAQEQSGSSSKGKVTGLKKDFLYYYLYVFPAYVLQPFPHFYFYLMHLMVRAQKRFNKLAEKKKAKSDLEMKVHLPFTTQAIRKCKTSSNL